jgi:hypothetical protein
LKVVLPIKDWGVKPKLKDKSLINLFRITPLLLSAAVLAGCASGTTLSETSAATTPPAPGQTRIAIYRDEVMGAAIQPQISVDAEPTGKCQPNGVFFVDVPVGDHTLSATTETTSEIQVDTSTYPVAYVKCSIGFGFFVGRPKLIQVATETGAAAVNDLVLTGTYSVP